MKLTDIRKLKVPELRSRLQEVGLDTRGLKAELVERLWSALDSRQSEDDTEGKLLNDSPATALPPAPTSLPVEAAITAADCAREFIDTATQTEPGAMPQQPGSEALSESVNQAEAAGAGDSRAPSSEEMGRGRAFYEFKEEIRYKR